MGEQRQDAVVPADAEWVDLTDPLVAEERARWCGLVDEFTPVEHEQGREMARWLRGCVHEGGLSGYTRAVHNHELLGFFNAETVPYFVSGAPTALADVTSRIGLRTPETGLLLSCIVRSANAGAGFGRILVEDAVGLALNMPREKITSILVRPANDKLRHVWRENHHFAPLGPSRRRRKSRYLHLPVALREELETG